MRISLLFFSAFLLLAACGEDDLEFPGSSRTNTPTATATATPGAGATATPTQTPTPTS